MADALVSGSSEISRVGSSPISCTNENKALMLKKAVFKEPPFIYTV